MRWLKRLLGRTGLVCAARGEHAPERVPFLGGFRCSRCQLYGWSLCEFVAGPSSAGYVEPRGKRWDARDHARGRFA